MTSPKILTTRRISIAKIKPYAGNIKKHPQDQIEAIAQGIKDYGWIYPVVLDDNNVLRHGHGSIQGAKLAGLKEVTYVRLKDLTEKQLKAFMVIDNKLPEMGSWDKRQMTLFFQDLDFDFTPFHMDFTDFKIVPDDLDEFIPPPEEPTSKLGQIYQLGKHRVLCADVTDTVDICALFSPDKTASLIFTDPPYNVGYSSRGKNKALGPIENDEMEPGKFLEFLEKAFTNLTPYTKENTAIYLCHGDTAKKAIPFYDLFDKMSWTRSTTIIWAKQTASMGWQDYRSQHEAISYGWKGTKPYFTDDRSQTTLWRISRDPQQLYEHPTQKPVELATKAIHNSSEQGEIVLDPFLGSGSTLIAAEHQGRACFGVEIDPRYVDVTIARWERQTGQKATVL